jgi:hypothetical protein
MRLTLAISTILLASLANGPQAAWGQMFSPNTQGQSLSPGLGSAFGSGGQNSLTGISNGLTGIGSGMTGQAGIGQSGTGIGQTRQPGDFIGVNSDQMTGRNFIGVGQVNGTPGASPGMSGYGNGGMSGFGARNSSMMPNGYGSGSPYGNSQGGMYGNERGAVSIRTTLTVGFENPSANSRQFSSSLAQRLADLPAIHWRTPGQVEIQGRTAILRGVVATEHDRDLAARVVRLEAAIDQVQNQLTVASNSAAPVKSSGAASESPTAVH